MKTYVSMTLFFLIFVGRAAFAEPLLKGSEESQIKQNAVADAYNLARIEDDAELEEMKAEGLLVRIPETLGIKIDDRLHERLRYVRPWVATYLIVLGRDFYNKFGTDIQINSAVRTVEYQIEISGRNKNAAPVIGLKRSSHLTSSSIDIAKLPLTREQKLWLRSKLVDLEVSEKAEATEEHRQAVFHVMIYPDYEEPQVKTAKQ